VKKVDISYNKGCVNGQERSKGNGNFYIELE